MTKEIELPFDIGLAPVTSLQAGRLSCVYEAGKLRYIRSGSDEVLRMVYVAVRTDQWVTLPFSMSNEHISVGKDSFLIHFTAHYLHPEPVYKIDFTIEGRADSSIVFGIKGEALAGFKRNRIGICVHHPIKECSNGQLQVTSPDGKTYQSVFPEMVSPHQPFHEIQKMEWMAGSDHAVITFDGDIFETEDQRNWSDSSYKTYSTPLRIPYPVLVQPGDAIQQKATIQLLPGAAASTVEPIAREEKIAFPKISYCRASLQPALTAAEIVMLQKIPFHHYRVMIAMDDTSWKQELQTALAEARQLNKSVELVAQFSGAFMEEVAALVPLLVAHAEQFYSLLLLTKDKSFTAPDQIGQLYPVLKNALPNLPVGYGTDLHFVNINRNRPQGTNFDFVSFSLHPQAHMNDNRSILENLDNQPDMIATARAFVQGKQVFVSPVSIRDRHYLPDSADERQYTAFAAYWYLLTLQQLGLADSITYCDLFGHAGLLQLNKNQHGETVSVRPSYFYEMLCIIQDFSPVYIVKRYTGEHLDTGSLLLENKDGERLLFKSPREISSFR